MHYRAMAVIVVYKQKLSRYYNPSSDSTGFSVFQRSFFRRTKMHPEGDRLRICSKNHQHKKAVTARLATLLYKIFIIMGSRTRSRTPYNKVVFIFYRSTNLWIALLNCFISEHQCYNEES